MRLLFSALLVLILSLARAQSADPFISYINRYKDIAIEEMKVYGIPASITLAQGIYESGCGNSTLAKKSNNHFGIKCHDDWTGQTYHHDDDLPQECFRVYGSAEESFRDHSAFLKSRPWYAGLFNLAPTDYKGWAWGLKTAGYATNPKYPQILIKVIEDYHLNQYDKMDGNAPTARAKSNTGDNPEVQIIKQSIIQSAKTNPPASPAEAKRTPNQVSGESSQCALEEKQINGVKVVIYKKEVSLESIAQKYNLSVLQLYAYNDMGPGDKFPDNSYLYLDNKKREAAASQYEVQEGETLHDVSQKFGIKVSALTERNGLAEGCQPLAGEVLVLRGSREFPIKYRANGKTYSASKPYDQTAAASQPDTRIHKVETKETLYSIARQYNIPVDTLKRINGLRDEDLKIGQTLIVQL